MKINEDILSQAVALARQSVNEGNHPFGAIIAHKCQVLLTAKNTVCTQHDCTNHAELNLVRKLEQSDIEIPRGELTLYTSTEPCAMCAGAIYWSGIRNIVFDVSAAELGEITGGNLVISCRSIFEKAKETVTVIGPFSSQEGIELHRSFWKK